jgi:sialate O-acetylesterase
MMFKYKIKNQLLSVVLFAVMLCISNGVRAKVKLPSLFSDNMVFQQKTKAAVWGKADPGKTITISTTWSRARYTSKADELGNWKIMVTTPSYGGPYAMTVSDGEPLILMNLLIGEVWICSGQSNMEMPLAGWGKINNYEQEIAAAKYPAIRLLQVDHTASNFPLDDAKVANSGWKPCIPEFVAGFSSVAYFFAREIYNKTKVPIGLIHTSWGGTVAEAWTSAPTLKTIPDFVEAVHKIEKADKDNGGPNRTTVLYNAMIHPYLQFPIKGVIWYQGEGNAGRAHQYRTLFPAMITDWRKQWGLGDFPFYFVQLANFMKPEAEPVASAWAELRDAQREALSLPNTGMAVAIDIGDAADIHPKNKQDVGKRLALIALAKTYGVKVPYTGPVYESSKSEAGTIRVVFGEAKDLKTSNGEQLKGFAIAGADQKFHWAKAEIKGNQVLVSSAEVPDPVAVRYAWANNPICNLVNGAGLPASPFRTDKWGDSTSAAK